MVKQWNRLDFLHSKLYFPILLARDSRQMHTIVNLQISYAGIPLLVFHYSRWNCSFLSTVTSADVVLGASSCNSSRIWLRLE